MGSIAIQSAPSAPIRIGTVDAPQLTAALIASRSLTDSWTDRKTLLAAKRWLRGAQESMPVFAWIPLRIKMMTPVEM